MSLICCHLHCFDIHLVMFVLFFLARQGMPSMRWIHQYGWQIDGSSKRQNRKSIIHSISLKHLVSMAVASLMSIFDIPSLKCRIIKWSSFFAALKSNGKIDGADFKFRTRNSYLLIVKRVFSYYFPSFFPGFSRFTFILSTRRLFTNFMHNNTQNEKLQTNEIVIGKRNWFIDDQSRK